jgi:rod shape-determining protein MreC
MPGFIDKNKKYLIILALFLLLFWLITIQVKLGRFAMLERPVLGISGFFERVISWPYHTVKAVYSGYINLVRTERQNRRMKEELDRLRLENQLTNEILAENDRLRDMLGFQKQSAPRSIVALVIAKESSASSSSFTVNKGTGSGVERNMPVITADGVVGRVQTALPGTAKVMLITDPGSTLAVRVQRNREEGLLEGKLDRCALKYVSYYMDIQVGDLLITSGLDGIYPKGLPVAIVTSVSKQEASSFQTVYAEPVLHLSRVEEILVLRQ